MMIWHQFIVIWPGEQPLYASFSFFASSGVYAPFLACSKPFCVNYEGHWYFPLFRYLCFSGFYTKRLDIFFNLLIFTLPAFIIAFHLLRNLPKIRIGALFGIIALQIILFAYVVYSSPIDPAADPKLAAQQQMAIQKMLKNLKPGESLLPDWNFDLAYMTPYAKLNLVLQYKQRKQQNERLQKYAKGYIPAAQSRWLKEALREKRSQLLRDGVPPNKIPDDQTLKKQILAETPPNIIQRKTAMPTLWNIDRNNEELEIENQKKIEQEHNKDSFDYKYAKATIAYIHDRRAWLEKQASELAYDIMPLIRPFHWEDDAGGSQMLNQYVPWWELTRINRKDLVAALIFGVRISLVVGILAVGLSMIIAIPVGSFAGYYGGKWDILVSRLLEIWEAMPIFFMLLMVVAIVQSKSIFIVIAVIGLFGWTSFSRYVRGEFFKQRNLPYIEACRALGFRDSYIMFSHILPNAIPPVLTLMPFAIMGAITSEAGLSFLGLGEEGSCSWGVLMDEGRSAFPAESYLLWPPAILLTLLLVAIALVGDAFRDALDPKMH